MAGFNTVDSVTNALGSLGNGQYLQYNKTLPSTTVASVPHTMWESTGLPSASQQPLVGLASGRICSSSMAGALPFVNANTNMSMSIIAWDAVPFAAAGVGTLILIDRIWDMCVNNNQPTSGISGSDATSRLSPTEGAKLWMEVLAPLSAGANTITLKYTNQDGITNRVTPVITTVASAIRGRSINAKLYQDLQANDTGIRSLQTWTLTGGTATGTINVCLVREIAVIPQVTAAVAMSRDFVCEIPNLRKIYDNSCLTFIFLPNAAGTPQFMGTITIGCN